MTKNALDSLLLSVRACRLCEADLAHGVRPVLQVHSESKILIAGQAPGSKVHASGIPFDDPSGVRLRDWMGIDTETFYDASSVAILPMGFCYPGKGRSGDLPPQKICATTWREELLNAMPRVQLTLVIGQYALAWHLPEVKNNLTQTVQEWQTYGEHIMPLPHPSPRNNIWLKKNPWFEADVIPMLRRRVKLALSGR